MDWLYQFVGTSQGEITLGQMMVRAAIVFVLGVVLIRLTTPRLFSKATPLDIVLSIIIGSNLSRTLTGNAPFLEVTVATAFLVFLHAVLAHLAARIRWLADALKGKPRVLMRDGRLDRHAMQRYAVGQRDILTAIHEAGGRSLEEADTVILERDGNFAVILRQDEMSNRA